MKQIVLSDGQITLVSDEDFLFLVGDQWRKSKNGYVVRGIRLNGVYTLIYMHVVVASRMKIEGLTDHEDRNKLNNQRSNLRPATRSQNAANVGLRQDNTTGFKGVRFQKQSNKYEVFITVGGKTAYIGLYETPEEAARAYNAKAIELFGEFAFLNEGV